jgi:hypothetical protein
MGYTQVALEDKIMDMFPEARALSPRIRMDEDKDCWEVKFRKGAKEITVFLSKEDADACMDNTYCEGFGKEVKKVISKLQ